MEPLLNDPFSFYGSHLQMTQHDKLSLMQDGLLGYYKGKLAQESEKAEASKGAQDYMI